MSHDDLMPLGGPPPAAPPPGPDSKPAPSSTPGRAPGPEMMSLGGLGGGSHPASGPAQDAGTSVPGVGSGAPSGVRPPMPGARPVAPDGPPRPGAPSAVRRPMPMDDAKPAGSPVLKIVAGVIAATILLIAYFVFRTPPPVDPPSSFGVFTAKDNSFTCSAPSGWDAEPRGGAAGKATDVYGNAIYFRKGNAGMELSMSTVAGLLTSQLLFGDNIVPEAMGGSKAESIHRSANSALKKRYKGYVSKDTGERPVAMGAVVLKDGRFLADARLSEWTATGNKWGLGGKVHGYRATLAGRDLIASVVCYCSESDWPKMKPAFLKFISGVKEIPKADPRGILGGGGGVPGLGGSF